MLFNEVNYKKWRVNVKQKVGGQPSFRPVLKGDKEGMLVFEFCNLC